MRIGLSGLLTAALLIPACDGDASNGPAPCAVGMPFAPATVSYADDIRPLFAAAGCLSTGCHGGIAPTSGYDLRSHATSFGPGDEAVELGRCDIVPGDPDGSYLVEKVSSDDPEIGDPMPQVGNRLTAEEIELV